MHYTSPEVYEYISKQTKDPILEWKVCRFSAQKFAIYQSDLNFYTKISPSFDGKRFEIPTPTLCPEERQRRRLIFRNERKLYKRKCDATGESIISMYSPENPHKVYSQKYRRSDARDATTCTRDFDFSKSFTEQFKNLLLDVPRCCLLNEYLKLENSDYVNLAGPSKNCYLITETDRCENSHYGYTIYDCNSCIDCNSINFSELCYQCVSVKHCFDCSYCVSCFEAKYSHACVDCSNIQYCFGCWNLKGGEYMIANQQYTKQDYEQKLQAIKKQEYQKMLFQVQSKAVHKNLQQINSTGYGDNNTNSDHILFSYDIDTCRDCKYCTILHDANDCMDYFSWGLHSSLVYECQNSGMHLTNSLFCNFVWNNCNNILYSDLCPLNNSHLFGCVGLRNKSYCIFNKQYSKQDYEIMVGNIIRHMQESGERGEFFHPSLSPFSYNETVAHEYYPLMREEVLAKGYTWQDKEYPVNIPEGTETIEAGLLESDITKVDDDILKKAILCEVSGKPYRLIKPELAFYRKHSLPLPRKHPDIRHAERMKLRPGRSLFLRCCDSCGEEMVSVYPVIARDEAIHMDHHAVARDDQGKVYCEACYQKEVYG